MQCLKENFWFDDFKYIFNSIQIIPHNNQDLQSQLNAITRLVILICVVMWLFDFKYVVHFLVLSILFIIIIYYFQLNKMEKKISKEFFTSNLNTNYSAVKNSQSKQGCYYANIDTGETQTYCNNETIIDPPNKKAYNLNQNLSVLQKVDANPKTKIKPVVVPPAYDLESWRDNNLITFSAVNKPGVQEELYLSGYAESTCCDRDTIENYSGIVSPYVIDEKPIIPTEKVCEYYADIHYDQLYSPTPVDESAFIPTLPIVENYSNPNEYSFGGTTGLINSACGYNPKQLKVGLPSNLPVGNCQQNPKFSNYNKNLFTQIVSPGVYSYNQVNEPVNANIGISFTQQFEPTRAKRTDKGLEFTLYDREIIEPNVEISPKNIEANYDNIYDPRFYGYGTSYRSYLEPITGQTRFMYEDVNAIRMPNYITRSKIDHLTVADHYGPMKPGNEYGNVDTNTIREKAQEGWLADSLFFREDMSEKLMRKNNAIHWQKRMYPNSSRPVGSNAKFAR